MRRRTTPADQAPCSALALVLPALPGQGARGSALATTTCGHRASPAPRGAHRHAHKLTRGTCPGPAVRARAPRAAAPAPALGIPPGLQEEQGVLERWARLAWDGRIEQGHPAALPALCTAPPVPRAVLSIKSHLLQPMPGSGSSCPAALSDPSDPFLSPGCFCLLLHVKFISFLRLEKKHFQKASREQCSWADKAAAAPGAPRGSAAPQGPPAFPDKWLCHFMGGKETLINSCTCLSGKVIA